MEILIADRKPRRVALGDGRHVVGRGKDCAVAIDDMTLSRRHAALVVRGGAVTVADLDSLNGTFIDETVVHGPTEVGVGETVTFGDRIKAIRIAP